MLLRGRAVACLPELVWPHGENSLVGPHCTLNPEGTALCTSFAVSFPRFEAGVAQQWSQVSRFCSQHTF